MITQTEIITLAIKAIDADIEKWRTKCDVSDKGREMFDSIAAPLLSKRETLCTLYRIQTGTDFN